MTRKELFTYVLNDKVINEYLESDKIQEHNNFYLFVDDLQIVIEKAIKELNYDNSKLEIQLHPKAKIYDFILWLDDQGIIDLHNCYKDNTIKGMKNQLKYTYYD